MFRIDKVEMAKSLTPCFPTGGPLIHRLRLRTVRIVASGGVVSNSEASAEVAARFGYQPEAAFNRAFKRIHGFTPDALRQ